MKYSIIIACHNEGPDLEATVALVLASIPRPHEVIVVDDLSDAPLKPRLSSFPNVKCLRTESQIGAGPAKRLGCEAAEGDVFVILDSHMRMPSNWLDLIDEAVWAYPQAIFCTVCRGFDSTSKFIGCGASLVNRDDLFLGRRWLNRGSPESIDRCPCLLGACYIIPRYVWKALGGINPNFHGWGYGEQDLSIRAWLMGFEVRRINGLVVPHRFGREREGIFLNTWHNGFNAYVTAATVFEAGVFEELYLPFFHQWYDPTAFDRFIDLKDEILEFRRWFQDRRLYSDSSLHTLCDFRLPTIREQQLTLERLLQKRAETRVEKRPKLEVGQKKPAMGERHLQTILDRLPPNGRMLEYGSGFSTLWFRSQMRNGQSILSVEHNRRWYERIGGDVILCELSIPIGVPESEQLPSGDWQSYVRCNGSEKFDVILVDGVLRNECLKHAKTILNEDGRIFLHDANRDWYEDGRKNLELVEVHNSCSDYPGPTLAEFKA